MRAGCIVNRALLQLYTCVYEQLNFTELDFDYMNIELYLKIASTLTAIGVGCVLLWRANKELFFGSRNSLRDEYKFAKAFFDDLDKQPNMHPYARQKGLQAIAGNQSLPSGVIEYLLTLHDPASVLKDYVFARTLLEHFPTAGKKQISFKARYEKASRRKAFKIMYFSTYWISYFWAVSPILAMQWMRVSVELSMFLSLFTLPFLSVTLWSIRANIRMNRAESLVKNQ